MARERGTSVGRGVAASAAVVAVGLIALATLQYAMPASVRYPGPLDPAGAAQFARWLFGAAPPRLGVQAFVWSFRVLVVVVWAAYASLLVLGLRRGVGRTGRIMAGAVFLVVALAAFFPPSISHDLYAYLGYGRLLSLHGLDPYSHGLKQLAALGDPFAQRYPTPAPSVYGPLWTLLSTGVAWAGSRLSAPVQLAALKLVEAAALLGMAFAARAIARIWDPKHADLALLAVAFNPLLLIEGPGSGHNDILMVALMLAGTALVLRGRWQLGYLVIGMSVGIKWVSLAFVPWLVLVEIRQMPASRALGRAVASMMLAVLPLILAMIPLWSGRSTFLGLETVYSARATGHTSVHAGAYVVIALYVALTVWLWLGSRDRLAFAWSLWSLSAVLLAVPGILPWYLAWPIGMTLSKWDRKQVLVTAACMLIAVYLTLGYVRLAPI